MSEDQRDDKLDYARLKIGEPCYRCGKVISAPLSHMCATRSAVALLSPPTEEEIAAYRNLFRAELDKRMDTKHPSASPSTESHEIALRAFVEARNRATPSASVALTQALRFVDAIESLAFEMRPPNQYTPRIVELCNTLRHIIRTTDRTIQP